MTLVDIGSLPKTAMQIWVIRPPRGPPPFPILVREVRVRCGHAGEPPEVTGRPFCRPESETVDCEDSDGSRGSPSPGLVRRSPPPRARYSTAVAAAGAASGRVGR